ncbi:CARDB domain-containing protein [Halorientalis brevis]|uniref:CARDB domain-containing protein n=1 Tax=Halorientalis brevis TaxID=1126241 RepID=A0ABD6CHA9_9EURY|nr:CARDB domain-containing protein [Halorientalis brevis]
MHRVLALLLVAGLTVTAVPLGTASAQNTTAASTYVAVSNVTTSPENPAPGESVTIEPTIQNLRDSSDVVEVNVITVRSAGGTELVRLTDAGNVAPDSSLSVPLTTTFETPGTKQLRIHVIGEKPDGNSVHVRYPVTVSVEDHHPQLDMEANETAAGTEGTGTITVANGLSTTAQNVNVRLTSERLQLADDRFVVPSMESGESTTESFEFEAESAGSYPLTATMRYRVDGSAERVVEETITVDVERLRDNVLVEATTPERGTSTIEVDVLNRGNVPIENVTISGESANATVPSKLISEVSDGESVTRRVNATITGSTADVTMAANYDVGDQHRQARDAVRIKSVPGRIELTGVNVIRENGRLRVTGSASNVGATVADGVIVRVADTETVSPAPPSREYFVGSVPESDFVSFDVYARTTGNVSAIPLTVSYRAKGTSYNRTVSVSTAGSVGNRTAQPVKSSSGGLLVPAIGGLVVLVIGAVVFRSWRAGRAGT